ncbi:MAG: hypothetical protein HRT71_07695 [Flavobacteriales bacterium]|nr:hypothetical protein [Flavobacteriales bacterium]
MVTGSEVSHVATVLIDDDGRIRFFESSIGDMYPEHEGVHLQKISNILPFYNGNVWILPLSDEFRATLDIDKLKKYLYAQLGKEYDYDGLLKSGVDFLENIGIAVTRKDTDKFFCSELVMAAMMEAGDSIPQNVNPAEVTPKDIIQLKIFKKPYYMVKAANYKAIKLQLNEKGFDSLDTVK